jgi:hypothetical protein
VLILTFVAQGEGYEGWVAAVEDQDSLVSVIAFHFLPFSISLPRDVSFAILLRCLHVSYGNVIESALTPTPIHPFIFTK